MGTNTAAYDSSYNMCAFVSEKHGKGNAHIFTCLIYFPPEKPAVTLKSSISPVSSCVKKKKLIRQHSGDPKKNKQAGEVRSWPQLGH